MRTDHFFAPIVKGSSATMDDSPSEGAVCDLACRSPDWRDVLFHSYLLYRRSECEVEQHGINEGSTASSEIVTPFISASNVDCTNSPP